jgi:hypothetical protein
MKNNEMTFAERLARTRREDELPLLSALAAAGYKTLDGSTDPETNRKEGDVHVVCDEGTVSIEMQSSFDLVNCSYSQSKIDNFVGKDEHPARRIVVLSCLRRFRQPDRVFYVLPAKDLNQIIQDARVAGKTKDDGFMDFESYVVLYQTFLANFGPSVALDFEELAKVVGKMAQKLSRESE